MRRTGEYRTFRARLSTLAYNFKIRLWDNDANTGWVFSNVPSAAFIAFPNSESFNPGLQNGVVVTKVPLGHLDPTGPGAGIRPIPVEEDVVFNMSDSRQVAWGGAAAELRNLGGLADTEAIFVSDIYLSRVTPEGTLPANSIDSANCILTLEKVELTENESIMHSARMTQLSKDLALLGLHTRP
jgi:hypothetical protein